MGFRVFEAQDTLLKVLIEENTFKVLSKIQGYQAPWRRLENEEKPFYWLDGGRSVRFQAFGASHYAEVFRAPSLRLI